MPSPKYLKDILCKQGIDKNVYIDALDWKDAVFYKG